MENNLNENNQVRQPLVEKVLLAPLHITLGLVKNFIKALNKSGEAFKVLNELFPKLSTALSLIHI